MCGIVNPNETIFHNWTFRPERSLAYNFVLDCRLFAENFDKQSDIEIDVFGTSVEGSLIVRLNKGKKKSYRSCKFFFFSSQGRARDL